MMAGNAGRTFTYSFFGTLLLCLVACSGEEPVVAPEADTVNRESPVTPPQENPEQALISRARAIHDSVMTLDTHKDIPLTFATDEHDPLNADDAQVNLEKMQAGGLDAAFFIVYVGQAERNPGSYAAATADAITKFDAIHRMADEMYPDLIGLADTAEEARAIHADGRLVALIGIENGFVIGQDLSLLEDFRNRGARYMTLVHNGNNDIGDSAQPRPQFGDDETDDGLTDFGLEVVAEMNRLGILVDISHVSRQTMLEATAASVAPVIASHSSTSALADHPRNMNDEQLLALRDNGGVVQIVAFESYVKEVAPEKNQALQDLRESMGIDSAEALAALSEEVTAVYENELEAINTRWPAATVADFVDHIDYAVDLIGIDHVGISSDFDGGGGIEGWNDADETFNVTLELVRRGYTEDEIAKLWGDNVLRIMEEAEQVSAGLMQ